MPRISSVCGMFLQEVMISCCIAVIERPKRLTRKRVGSLLMSNLLVERSKDTMSYNTLLFLVCNFLVNSFYKMSFIVSKEMLLSL